MAMLNNSVNNVEINSTFLGERSLPAFSQGLLSSSFVRMYALLKKNLSFTDKFIY